MPKTTSHDPDLDELPGFAESPQGPAVGLADELDELEDLEPESPPESAAPSTTSPSPNQSESAPEPPRIPSSSTPASTEPDLELREGIEFLAGSLFEILGQFLNRLTRVRRRGQQTAVWLVTEDEAERFAAPVARIAERHLPEELQGGDARDTLLAAAVGVEYTTRNLAGVTEPVATGGPVDLEELRRREPEVPAAPPPPAAGLVEPPARPEAPPLVSPNI